MTKNKSVVEESVEKLKETALELERFMRFLDAMDRFGNEVLGQSTTKNDCQSRFFEGLYMMRQAVYEKTCHNLADCFMFSAVSEGMRDLASEKLKTVFGKSPEGSEYCVMQFLSQWGNVPRSWRSHDETAIRKEVKEKLKHVRRSRKRKAQKSPTSSIK